jgi:hypothetical protein
MVVVAMMVAGLHSVTAEYRHSLKLSMIARNQPQNLGHSPFPILLDPLHRRKPLKL